MTKQDKINGLCAELLCGPEEATTALLRRHELVTFAREYIEVNRKIKSGETKDMSDHALYPLWTDYLQKQNG